MAKRKRTPSRVQKKVIPKKESRFPNFLLALTFLIIVSLLFSLFFKNSHNRFSFKNIIQIFTRSNSVTQKAVTVTPTPHGSAAVAGKDYVVKPGDHLWKIAEESYGSGYNAYDIAKANNLKNPSEIEVGMHLKLPKVEAKAPTKGEVAGEASVTFTPSQAPSQAPRQAPYPLANKSEYIVQRGDNLWNIALQRYGDGFMWRKIAEVNNLANPRVIHSGNRLLLPS